MYSAVFAVTVILGIAVTNLFLGFAAALLLGRGPRRWSDVDRAIVIQPVVLNLPKLRCRARVERLEVPLAISEATESSASTVHDAVPSGQQQCDAAPQDVGTLESVASDSAASAVAASPAPPVAATPVPEILMPPPAFQIVEQEHRSPTETLQEQLESWRQGEPAVEDVPSLSGLSINMAGISADSPLQEVLSEAIYARIKAQVRRDRRVLRIEPLCFAWFSPDVLPDDALMPVERIRQFLDHTRFLHQGEPVELSIVAGVVAALADDDSARLLDRLRSAWHFARQEGSHPTALDTGEGPLGVKPYAIELEDSDCELPPAG